jgi:hypothetical protein
VKSGGQPFAALTVGSRAVGKRKTLAETGFLSLVGAWAIDVLGRAMRAAPCCAWVDPPSTGQKRWANGFLCEPAATSRGMQMSNERKGS